jgi:hypothetical protein
MYPVVKHEAGGNHLFEWFILMVGSGGAATAAWNSIEKKPGVCGPFKVLEKARGSECGVTRGFWVGNYLFKMIYAPHIEPIRNLILYNLGVRQAKQGLGILQISRL